MAVAAVRPFPGMRSAVYREPGVCKLCSAPGGRCMALGAIPGKSGSPMIGICNTVVFTRMTGIAITRRSRIHACNVAFRALNTGMRARQLKACAAVVESRGRPAGCAMANRTILGKSRAHVIGISCAVVARKMAGDTSSRQRRIEPVFVAR
jgi:hypothetical protein